MQVEIAEEVALSESAKSPSRSSISKRLGGVPALHKDHGGSAP